MIKVNMARPINVNEIQTVVNCCGSLSMNNVNKINFILRFVKFRQIILTMKS